MAEPDSAPDPLTRLAQAWLGRDPGMDTPLHQWLAQHPEACARLTEALLMAELAAGSEPEPAADLPEDADAQHLGPYRLLRELGRGGQATVFDAVDTRLGRRVALKVLQRNVFATSGAAERFRAEAATTSRLDHPGICPIYEIGEADDCLYLAMRFVEGETLAARIASALEVGTGNGSFDLALDAGPAHVPGNTTARGPRRWVGVLHFFESAALALHAAHDAGVVHRDVKPGNMMVQRDGTAVVLDFGLAGDAGRDGATLTRSGEVFGTPAYMAPEQCRDPRQADRRSDVFALGASLYETLTGQRPFQGRTPEAIVSSILSGYVPDPRRLVRALPREFALVTGKAMDPDPARRYPTAAAFADDLRRIAALRPVLAVPPSLALRARRWVQRNPAVAAVMLVVLVAGGMAVESMASAHTAEQERAHLADVQLLGTLQAEFRGLLPITADAAPAQEWLSRAEALVTRLPEHRRQLALLREHALPRSAAEREQDRRAHPDHARLELLLATEESLEHRRGTKEGLETTRKATAKRAEDIERLRTAIDQAATYEFATQRQQILHDGLQQLVAGLGSFAADTGPFGIVHRALQRHRADRTAPTWAEMIESVRSLPCYGGLQLRPQAGLAPLRRDRHSGLWELLLVHSGDMPEIQDDGTLAVTEQTGIVFVLLPGGPFRMGATKKEGDRRHDPWTRPAEDFLVEVELKPFLLSKYEVTQAQWMRLSDGPNPSRWQPGHWSKWANGITLRHPVENVTWDQATAVLDRHGLVLPTEAQWEYAARAGNDGPWWTGPQLAALEGAENLRDITAQEAGHVDNGNAPVPWRDGFILHAPVGTFRANTFGFHDILGNVTEWCRDGYAMLNRHLLRSGDGGLLSGDSYQWATRGGNSHHNGDWARASLRAWATGRDESLGVRPARRIDQGN